MINIELHIGNFTQILLSYEPSIKLFVLFLKDRFGIEEVKKIHSGGNPQHIRKRDKCMVGGKEERMTSENRKTYWRGS